MVVMFSGPHRIRTHSTRSKTILHKKLPLNEHRHTVKMSGKMTQSDKERIQSSQAQGGKDMSSGGFAARAQSAADRNANAGGGAQQQGGQGGQQQQGGKK
ncbi:hypothetical protein LZ30DRAFT_722667 [Colletotrichum cereale]|nr:hypothetical protein LZ30DRAFT_722667 [Colletotrichum cereale]